MQMPARFLPGIALLLLSGAVHGQLDQGMAAATAAQAGQLNEAVQNLTARVSGQLRDVVDALAKSGQLPIAAQTIAGFISHTFCEGAVSNSSYAADLLAIITAIQPCSVVSVHAAAL